MSVQIEERPALLLDPTRERTSNRVEIVGYVGRRPETRYTTAGKPVTEVSLATHRWSEQDGNPVQWTDWHTIVAYDELAGRCAALQKGALVRATGWLRTRTWSGRVGDRKRVTEIVLTGLTPIHSAPVQLPLP